MHSPRLVELGLSALLSTFALKYQVVSLERTHRSRFKERPLPAPEHNKSIHEIILTFVDFNSCIKKWLLRARTNPRNTTVQLCVSLIETKNIDQFKAPIYASELFTHAGIQRLLTLFLPVQKSLSRKQE